MGMILFGTLVCGPAFAYEISTVKVSGDRAAEIVFQATPAPDSVPTLQVQGNSVDITFFGADLSAALQGKLEVNAPHALVQSISLVGEGHHTVRGRIQFNGGAENLRNRLTLNKDERGITIKVDTPKGGEKALELFREEQLPLDLERPAVKLAQPTFQPRQLLLVVILLSLAGGCTFFFFRFLRAKGKWAGSRKHLIEQIAYCPLGGRAGVALIKVGKEFALVGVTPQQVNLLSSLPKLAEEYEDETKFERDSFREAVGEEVKRMQKEVAL